MTNPWISPEEIARLPTSGPAWENVLAASTSIKTPDLSNQDDDADVHLFAGALVAVRAHKPELRDHVAATCLAAEHTEAGGRALAEGRNVIGVVLAADLVGLAEPGFWNWAESVLHETVTGGPRTLVDSHEHRPNNWGTHAGASRLAIDLCLLRHGTAAQRERARADGVRAVRVWKGWFGDRAAYAGFDFGALDWQSDPKHPVGINPRGAAISGHSVDGVLPDDQRRSGGFAWPPPHQNYVWEALQGATAAAWLMSRGPVPGVVVWEWSDRALLRAFKWLHEEALFPASGDDEWAPWIVNKAYGTKFAAHSPARSGKNVGFTDWTHAV